jgi:predicted ATP-grasp superfamily ATP-dependent carboligase
MRVLFLGSVANCATAVVRALARAGHVVDLASCARRGRQRYADGFISKYVRRTFALPVPHENPQAFRYGLRELLLRDTPYDVLLPFNYAQNLAVARMRDELESHVSVAVGPTYALLHLHEKDRLYDTAEAIGIATPRRIKYTDWADLRAKADCFPLVLKPRREEGARGLRFARTMRELEQVFHTMQAVPPTFPELEDFTRPIVQEYVPGHVHDVGYLFCEGKLRMAVSQRRNRMYPLWGGPGVDVVTTQEPDLIEQGRALLERVGWHGVCQVEFKRDSRDGSPRLLDVNPRFWGTLDVAIQAGANFPAKLCELVTRGDTAEQYEYRVGMRYVILLPLMLFTLCQSRGARRARLNDIRDAVRGHVHCEIELRDLRPHLWMLGSSLWKIMRQHKAVLAPDPLSAKPIGR